MALACDLRVASDNCTMGLNEVALGIPVPDYWAQLMVCFSLIVTTALSFRCAVGPNKVALGFPVPEFWAELRMCFSHVAMLLCNLNLVAINDE